VRLPAAGGWRAPGTMADGDVDLLYALRNNYHLGAYQAAIAEANDLQHDDLGEAENVERDIFLYRAYIELGQAEVAVAQIDGSAPMALQAVKLLAQVRSQPETKDQVLETVSDWLSDPAYGSNVMLATISGEIFYLAEKYEEALKCCSSASSLEQ